MNFELASNGIVRDLSFVPFVKLPFIYMDPKPGIPIKKRYLFIPPHIHYLNGDFPPCLEWIPSRSNRTPYVLKRHLW